MTSTHPWSVQFLLPTRPPTVGHAIEAFLPNFGEDARLNGAQRIAIPAREHEVHLWVDDAEPAAAVAAEATTAPAADAHLARELARTHRATLSVGLQQVVSTRDGHDIVHAMVTGLCEDGPPSPVLWFAHQERLMTAGSVQAAAGRKPRELWYAVHAAPDQAVPGTSWAWTRGLSRIGLPEIELRGSSTGPEELRASLAGELDYTITERRSPEPGKRIKVAKTWYEITPATDPTTGKPYLDLVAVRGRDAPSQVSAGGATTQQPRRR